VQCRDGRWRLLGFRNQEARGILSFELVDPVPVGLHGGALVAQEPRHDG
jgi:hypothetical protein